MKHVVGEIHKNGKWMWTEYKEGKFDWRNIPKTPNATPKSETKGTAQTTAVSDKPRTKKTFISETGYDLTEKECEEYFWNWGKILDTFVRSSWSYAMGRIGSCRLTIESSKSGRKKDFEKHPDWRPLGFYKFSTRDWFGKYIEIRGFVQSWDEIRKISDTEDFIVQLVKHPHQ